MVRFLKELSVEDIKEFSTAADFERYFYASLFEKPKKPKSDSNPLEQLHADYLKFLNGSTFSNDPAFGPEFAEVEISTDKMQILKLNVEKFMGRNINEIFEKAVTLDSLAPTEAQPILREQIEKISKGPVETPMSVAFKNEKNELVVLDISGAPSSAGNSYVLKMVERTNVFAKALGKRPDTEKAAADAAKKPLDVIIFRYDLVGPKSPNPWVTKTAALLQKASYWPAENRPKFIAVRRDADNLEKALFNHPFIDDLLCIPLDRLIFLQKVELVLGLPKKASPSHLFVQETDEKIEIAKRMQLERVSDLGFAMANPFPLKPGTLGHFYFRLPGQNPLLDVHGKVL